MTSPHEFCTDRTIDLVRWSKRGFPEAWELFDVAGEPTRFRVISVIVTKVEHLQEIRGIRLRGFPQGGHLGYFFEVDAVLNVYDDITRFVTLEWTLLVGGSSCGGHESGGDW